MERAGVPTSVLMAVGAAWRAHTRWVTFGSNVDPRPVTGSPALMQGDPWAPYAMALILAAPLRKISQLLPASFQITYLDDRTAVFPNLQDLETFLAEWRFFESHLRLKSNASKNQFWGRTARAVTQLTRAGYKASDHIMVLGMQFGLPQRAAFPEEKTRLDSSRLRALQIGSLPVSARLKLRCSIAMVAAKAVWGQIFNCRVPTKSECTAFRQSFHQATRDPHFLKGRAAPELKQCLFLGHTSDLALHGVLRFLKASFAWAEYRLSRGVRVRWQSDFLLCLNQVLTPHGWQALSHSFRSSDLAHSCRFGDGPDHLSATLHHLRDAWRVTCATSWLRKTTRIDSDVARANHLTLSAPLLNSVRRALEPLDAHAVAVACGGFQTAAINFERLGRGLPALPSCPYCSTAVVPSLVHVLWSCPCPAFASLRLLPQASCAVASRLGWSDRCPPTTPRFRQMAAIRAAKAQLRLAPATAAAN